MKITVIAFLTLAVFFTCQSSIDAADKIKIDVYYEALCPDSKDFLVGQLYPVYINKSLGKLIDLTLVPFGKASYKQVDGNLVFTCQHGEKECYANMMQACVLNMYNVSQTLEYSKCMMSEKHPDAYAIDCATKLSLDANKISECQKSKQGQNYLKQLGDKTHSLKPKMNFVPWLIVDNKFNAEDLQKGIMNFKSLICSKIPEGSKPENCS